jgi:UDP-N-acetylglucosamine 1-carboxyvinyltransferase
MSRLKIEGGLSLNGKIRISGSKNSGLAILAGSLLCKKKNTLIDLPNIKDIHSMNCLLANLGSTITYDASELYKFGSNTPVLIVDNLNINKLTAEYDFVKKMRASIFVLGPLLTRFGTAKVSLPGGCAIGVRGVDIHVDGLRALGANIKIENGYVNAEAKNGLVGCEYKLKFASVGATENLMSAAVLAKGRTILNNAAKEPEIIALADFFNSIGAKISGHGTNTIIIDGVKEEDLHETEFNIPADRIEAGTYAIAAAITDGKILLTNCDINIFEGCKDVFKEIGIGLKEIIDDDGKKAVLVFKAHDFKPYNVKTDVFPGFPTDLQAQTMVPLLLAKGESSVVENIFDNRFMHVAELCRMGAQISVKGNTAFIKGGCKLNGANVMATDLRASASLVLAGLVAEGETIIDRIYHLDRGYENLELKLNNCGAKIERIKSCE